MRIALVFPPIALVTQPHLATPSLTAFLKSHSHHEVLQLDLNIQGHDHLLTRRYFDRLKGRLSKEFRHLNSGNKSKRADYESLYSACRDLLLADFLSDHISASKSYLKSSSSLGNLERLLFSKRVLDSALRLVHSYCIISDRRKVRKYFSSSRNLFSNVSKVLQSSRNGDPFVDFFEDKTMPRIGKFGPDLVGISVTYGDQFIYSLILAYLLKERFPRVHVTAGGNHIRRIFDDLRFKKELFSLFDSVVPFEGETALLNLAGRLEESRDLSNIPNLAYCRNGQVCYHVQKRSENVDQLPTPDFTGLPLNLYISPSPVLPILFSRGCYWRRCIFCSHYKSYQESYSQRSPDLILRDIAKLSKKHRTPYFYIVDEATAPSHLRRICKAIAEKKLRIKWMSEARMEKQFDEPLARLLRRCGCRMLVFGFESGSQRILNLMDKGLTTPTARGVIRNCSRAGITTALMFMIGFPTETKAEALKTLNFILENRRMIDAISFDRFRFGRGSKIFDHPERYGIGQVIGDPGRNDLLLIFDFSATGGMSPNELEHLEGLFNTTSPLSELIHCMPDRIYGLFLSRRQLNRYSDIVRMRPLRPSLCLTGSSKVRPILNPSLRLRRIGTRSGEGEAKKSRSASSDLRSATSVLTFNFHAGTVHRLSGDASLLLRLCNGRNSISTILKTFAKKKRLPLDFIKASCLESLNTFLGDRLILTGRMRHR